MYIYIYVRVLCTLHTNTGISVHMYMYTYIHIHVRERERVGEEEPHTKDASPHGRGIAWWSHGQGNGTFLTTHHCYQPMPFVLLTSR